MKKTVFYQILFSEIEYEFIPLATNHLLPSVLQFLVFCLPIQHICIVQLDFVELNQAIATPAVMQRKQHQAAGNRKDLPQLMKLMKLILNLGLCLSTIKKVSQSSTDEDEFGPADLSEPSVDLKKES